MSTRDLILNAAIEAISVGGPDHINVSKIAHIAGVNRSTAYKYFPTREDLVSATIDWMSERLFTGVFGASGTTDMSLADLTDTLVNFAMDNPDLGRVWLLEVLSAREGGNDLFWNQIRKNFSRFAKAEGCRPDVDSDVLAVLFLGAFFLWPVFSRAQYENGVSRSTLADRLAAEVLRFSAFGLMKADCDVEDTSPVSTD